MPVVNSDINGTLVQILNRILSFVITALFAGMLSCVIWQVCSRYIINIPSTSTDELARLIFIWLGLLGAAYAYGKNKHLTIDLLPDSLSPRKKIYLHLTTRIITGVFALTVLIYSGSKLAWEVHAMEQVTPVLNLSAALMYLPIPFSGVFILLYAITDLLTLTNKSSPEDSRHV